MRAFDWLLIKRKVRFGDCDSAGVIHFYNLFRWSHEAWEESLESYGIKVNDIFPSSVVKNQIVFPIVNCESKFFKPIKFGDLISIKITPTKINNHLFKVDSYFFKDNSKVAEGTLIHCSILSHSRKKVSLPDKLELWIEASNIQDKVKEC